MVSSIETLFLTGVSQLHAALGTLLYDIADIHLGAPVVLILVSLILFFSAQPLNKIIAEPYLLIMRLLRLSGIVHDQRTWGVVYDSITKEPVDPAYVTVRGRLGTIVATALTDLDGRFGIIVPQGIYTLSVEKTHYVFPSTRLVGKVTDGYYTGLYFGGQFEVTESERSLAFAVPIDPVGSDWNQLEKRRKHLHAHDRKAFRYAAGLYFFVAGFLIALRYAVFREAVVLQLFQIYGGIMLAGLLYVIFIPTAYYHSVIIDKGTRKPLGFARIKVFNNATNSQVAAKVSSINGQFVCLVPNGTYYVTIERRTENGLYVLVHTSDPFRVLDRAINRQFLV